MARLVESEEAPRLGLVNTVVPDAALEDRVSAYAAQVAENAPLTVRTAMAAVGLYERNSETKAPASIAQRVLQCFDSDDYKEGRRAFLDKRRPVFEGR